MPDSFILTVQNIQGTGTSEYSFDSGELTVGRGDSCDVVLDSDRVSRMHAAFAVAGHAVTVRDLGSANGTYVNEKRISQTRELLFDDVVRVGDCTITVRGGCLRPDRAGGVYLRLKGVSPAFTGTVLEFSKSPSLVGRGDEADLSIVDPSVSRQHAKVQRRHDGSVLISDLSSANGTKVNRRGISVCDLAPGDRVSIGRVDFVAELPGAPTIAHMSSVRLAVFRLPGFSSSAAAGVLWIVAAILAAFAVMLVAWRLGGLTGGVPAAAVMTDVVDNDVSSSPDDGKRP